MIGLTLKLARSTFFDYDYVHENALRIHIAYIYLFIHLYDNILTIIGFTGILHMWHEIV